MDVYKIFSPEEAAAYVRQALPEFSKKGPLRARRLAGDSRSVDGHVNEITRVEAVDGSSVILKQLMPHVNLTSHGEVYELPLARMAVEVHALRFWERLCPGAVPQIYLWAVRFRRFPAGAVQGEESILFSNYLHFPQKNGAGGEFRGFLQRQAAGVYFLLWPGGHPGSHAVCRLGGCAPAPV